MPCSCRVLARLKLLNLCIKINVSELLSNKPLLETFVSNIRDSSVDSDNTDLYKISRYTFVHRKRDTEKGGGVGIYIKDGIRFVRRSDLDVGLRFLLSIKRLPGLAAFIAHLMALGTYKRNLMPYLKSNCLKPITLE